MNNQIVIKNNALKVVLEQGSSIVVKEFSNIYSGITSNQDKGLFSLKFMGGVYTEKDFEVADVISVSDKTQELVTILFKNEKLGLDIKVHFINDLKETINVLYQIRDKYIDGYPYEMMFHSPLLGEIALTGDDDTYYFPENSVRNSKGEQVMILMSENFATSDVKVPLVICDDEDKYGFSVLFPTHSDLDNDTASQNRNMMLSRIKTLEELRSHDIMTAPDDSFNDTIELQITGLKQGWVEAFDRFRDYWETYYDFSEYEKEDLKWFNDCVVHNFVFLFGKEGFDHEKQKIDIDKLLKDGEEFGGYDTVTIWNQYPRLGIDERTQWDFYDDFPGGRDAIKQAVKECHDKGVYLFLPYIPWDRGNHECTNTMGDEFARIVADTDADGYQLDTMRNLPESFREKLDAIRPGIILTTQAHPSKRRPLEFITTSWDEFWYTNPMPEVDVFRFLCPRHVAPVLSRWLRNESKSLIIERAKFGAAPVVIWQDVFGRWLPFNDEQKAEIANWKKTFLQYKDIYFCKNPTPLIPTKTDDLYCNLFRSDDKSSAIYSFYNDSDADITSSALSVHIDGVSSAQVILGDGSCEYCDGKITVTVKPHQVTQVLVK